MKRASLILFTAFYLMVSLGVSLNLHYCGGKLASVSIDLPGDKCCCGDESTNSCCSDASLSMAMDVDQQLTAPPSFELEMAHVNLPIWVDQAAVVVSSTLKITPHFPNPPPISSVDLRIQMGALTYYG